jgi:transposase InsO family protein
MGPRQAGQETARWPCWHPAVNGRVPTAASQPSPPEERNRHHDPVAQILSRIPYLSGWCLWRKALKDYEDGWDLEAGLTAYFHFYCEKRVHQSLDYRTPADVYHRKG